MARTTLNHVRFPVLKAAALIGAFSALCAFVVVARCQAAGSTAGTRANLTTAPAQYSPVLLRVVVG